MGYYDPVTTEAVKVQTCRMLTYSHPWILEALTPKPQLYTLKPLSCLAGAGFVGHQGKAEGSGVFRAEI